MRVVAVVVGFVVILIILGDAFETIVLPRRVSRRLRLSRQFFRHSWHMWASLARRLPAGEDHEGSSIQDRFLGVYGPLALIALVGLWACTLILGFAILAWGLDLPVTGPNRRASFGTLLYMSGATFFTLGYGDIAPLSADGRALAVVEVGMGFSFLALIIGYLPITYSAFSRRETNITLLDARAGSPPTAVELLRRHALPEDARALEQMLQEWERWSAELLESHLSYPVLSFFRSQHEHLSWLAALTMIMDSCALLMVGVRGAGGSLSSRQARLTFAMARHAIGDLCQTLYAPPRTARHDRLPANDVERMRALLAETGLELRQGADAERWLAQTRSLYEPYVAALAAQLLFTLPQWLPAGSPDDWQTTAWEWSSAALPPRDGLEEPPRYTCAHSNPRVCLPQQDEDV